MNYLKERNKMRILLIGGILLAIVVLFMLNSVHLGLYVTSFNGLFLLAAIRCYPLAIVYGRRQIVDVFNSIRIGERQAISFTEVSLRTYEANLYITKLHSLLHVTRHSLAGFTEFYTAYQKLTNAKGLSGEIINYASA